MMMSSLGATCILNAISIRINAVFQVAPMELKFMGWNCFYNQNTPKELGLVASLVKFANEISCLLY
ncbi:MAG: hypothetical protein ACOYOA_03470 [Saprospiraceae bacterium]